MKRCKLWLSYKYKSVDGEAEEDRRTGRASFVDSNFFTRAPPPLFRSRCP